MSKNEPAFPLHGFMADASGAFTDTFVKHSGMTLRQWYAGLAMQSILSNHRIYESCCAIATEDGVQTSDIVARLAYANADAMLTAREAT